MTTTTPSKPVTAPAVDDAPSPQPLVRQKQKTQRSVLPVVVGAVAFGAGVVVGSRLTWRFSAWWKPG
ncbi:hypothetical protein [Intrasporangium sp. YIM S08009]|uniref:hypothetical protein n=1 Tax=Intrasporangium zincisolvens TaxID=3080018 RepID=UPI002B058D65|nr:hypothetical protein [Intrasporangium sp. YIM S08009]